MSRIVAFDLDNVAMGEIQAICTRGWAINDAGQGTVDLSADQMAPWLDLGRMVMVEDSRLPAWAGMIDTPWKATLPAQMTLYNAEYLLHIRCPDQSQTLTGSTASIVLQLLAQANAQEDLYIRTGVIDQDPSRSETFDQTPFWDQIVKLVKAAGMELRLRPARDANNKLVIYLDLQNQLGIDTGFLLHDGEGANMNITKALVDNEIFNRVIGIGSKSAKKAQLQTAAQIDQESINHWRMRSTTVQFTGVTSLSLLTQDAKISLQNTLAPALIITADLLNVGDTFKYADLGNIMNVRATRLCLPGGQVGWEGKARIMVMSYDESKNVISTTLTGYLQP